MLQRIINIYVKSFEGLSKGSYMLALMMFFNRLGTLIFPFLTLYITVDLGYTVVQAGTASAMFSAGGLVGAFLGGVMSDKMGQYRTMFISLLGAGVVFISIQWVQDFYWLCGLLFAGSMLADILRPAVMSMARLYTTPETQTRGLSLLRMAFNLGFSIGPALAGLLISLFSYKVIFIIDGATCLLAIVFLVAYLRDDSLIVRPASSLTPIKTNNLARSPYTDGPFMAFLLSALLMLIAFFQLLVTFPLYLKQVLQYDESQIGIFFAINGVMVFLLEMPLVHYVEKKYSSISVIKAGTWMIAIGTALLFFHSLGLAGVLGYLLILSVGEIISFPFITTEAMHRAGEGDSGKYMAAVSVIFSLSIILASKMGTSILDRYGFDVLWLSMAGLCVLAIIGFVWVRRHIDTPAIADTAPE